MMARIALVWLLAALLVPPGAAQARNLAILFVNERYESYPDLSGAGAILALEEPLQRAGFDVVTIRDMRADTISRAVPPAWRRLDANDRLIVVVAGHIVRSPYDAWLLASDASGVDVFSVGQSGLSLGALMRIGESRPGRTLLAVARSGARLNVGFGVESDSGWGDTPQGVTVIDGAPGAVADFLSSEVLRPGRILLDAAREAPGLRLFGYRSRAEPFLPAATPRDAAAERAAWQRAESRGTVRAYNDYLELFPTGRFADEARRRIADLELTPADRAKAEEEALALTRSQRRGIQSDLSILGFDTRGIDGIFGPGTRRAISDWQASIGLPPLGYLSANQITRLNAEAAERRAALAAEAERRREADERRDRAYWAQTGASGEESGLRAYLERYPDGIFAENAQARLDAIEERKRRAAQVADRQAWDRAAAVGTIEGYRAYLQAHPEGLFVGEARARIRALASPETLPEIIEQARAEEASLGLNPVSRRLIEARLAQLDYEPGPVDGNFDRASRRAIRRFQRDNDIAVTGYVTRATVVRLVVSLDQ